MLTDENRGQEFYPPMDSMNCPMNDQPLETLKQEGWQEIWSFHDRFPEQWNAACRKVETEKQDGLYDILCATNLTDETAFKDAVRYLLRRKTPKLLQWEKEHGY